MYIFTRYDKVSLKSRHCRKTDSSPVIDKWNLDKQPFSITVIDKRIWSSCYRAQSLVSGWPRRLYCCQPYQNAYVLLNYMLAVITRSSVSVLNIVKV